MAVALGSLAILWVVAGFSSPLGSSFQSLIIWLWAAVIYGSKLPLEEAALSRRGQLLGDGSSRRVDELALPQL